MVSFKKIETKATLILKEQGVQKAPVNINKVAKECGAKILFYPLENGVSGVLVFDEQNNGTIGINVDESDVRKRFTIAHELGHLILHSHLSQFFVDKDFKVMFRSEVSANDKFAHEYEVQANAFAAAILMPEFLIQQEIDALSLTLDVENGDAVKLLAKKFNVSVSAMFYRLGNLGFL